MLIFRFFFASTILPLIWATSPACDNTKCVEGPAAYTRCRVHCGVEYPGRGYSKRKVPSLSACITACDQDPRCTVAQYDRKGKYCSLKDRAASTYGNGNAYIDSVICSHGLATSTTTRTLTTTTTTKYSYPTSTPCTRGSFKIQMTMANGLVSYFYDYGNNPTFVGVTEDSTLAGIYTLNGTSLRSVAVPGAVVYSISGFGPGPNPPPNSRALYEGVPGTLDPSTGENLELSVTVKDQSTCSLALTDGVRTTIGVAGFRGGPSVYIAPPGTTQNFQEAIVVRAISL